MKITKKLLKKSIIKAAIDDYIGGYYKNHEPGIDKTIKVLNLIENVETNRDELIDFLKQSLNDYYDDVTEKFNKLDINVEDVIIDKPHNSEYQKLLRYFKFISVVEPYYGIVRIGILFILQEGDSYSSYDMSHLTDDFSKLYSTSISFSGDDIIHRSKMNKEQIKSSKKYNMRKLYRELAEDGACNSDGMVYMSDGMGLNSDGEFEEM
jgi:hypothetical protein